MKKSKIISSKQIVTVAMILALGGAVWLNVSFAGSGKNVSDISDDELGKTKYVGTSSVAEKKEEYDYFKQAKKDRETSRDDEIEIIKSTLGSQKSTEAQKSAATDKIKELTDKSETENNIETLIKAKNFSDAIAVMNSDNCTVVVKSDKELTEQQSVIILDIVYSSAKIAAENVKIVTVK